MLILLRAYLGSIFPYHYINNNFSQIREFDKVLLLKNNNTIFSTTDGKIYSCGKSECKPVLDTYSKNIIIENDQYDQL